MADINPADIKKELLDLATDIQKYDSGAAFRLGLLSDAVEGKGAEPWVYADVFTVIDPDGIVERYKRHQGRSTILSLIEVARNTLIFAPIMITWYGISQATQQYSALLHSHPDQGSQPFLYLWEQGFGGNNLTISSIATLDALILAIIFFLTFFAYTLDRISENRIERDAQDLRSRMVHTLAGAVLILQANRHRVPLTAGDNLEAAARKLNELALQTTNSLNAMMRQVVSEFDGMIKKSQTQIDAMVKESGNQLKGLTQQITGHFTSLTNKMATQLQESHTYLQKLTSFATGIDQLAQQLQESARVLQKTSGELVSGVNNLVTPTKDLAQQQQLLLTATRESTSQLQGVSQTLSDLTTKQEGWSTELSESLDTLHDAINQAMQLANSVSSYTTQQTTFLEQLQKEREAQQNLVMMTTQSSAGLTDALKGIQEGGTDIRAISVDLHNILNLQKAANSNDIALSYHNAAQSIERSGQSLHKSAIAIYEASRHLTDIINDLQDQVTSRP